MSEEKKLTDEELVKNIEYCMTHDDCSEDCPMCKVQACMLIMLEQSLDLIHRLQDESAKQKAKIERLTEHNYWLESEHEYQCEKSYFEGVKKGQKQSVKDTAKEILCELLDLEVKDMDYEMFFLDVCDKLEKFAQKYGLEVE